MIIEEIIPTIFEQIYIVDNAPISRVLRHAVITRIAVAAIHAVVSELLIVEFIENALRIVGVEIGKRLFQSVGHV